MRPAGPHVACALIMTETTSTSTGQAVSEEQVLQVAALANLELTPEELPAMGRDLNAILGYIAQLNELDVAQVAPMSQVSEIVAGIIPDALVRRAKRLRCARISRCPAWTAHR